LSVHETEICRRIGSQRVDSVSPQRQMSPLCSCGPRRRRWLLGFFENSRCELVSSCSEYNRSFSEVIVECPLAHVCPYLRDTAVNAQQFDKIPKDHIEKLLQKCPRLANSPQAKHHVSAALLGQQSAGDAHEKCPYIARPDDDASMTAWEEFYKRSAECPWIQEHGIQGLAKSPKAYEVALQVSLLTSFLM
jgi:hypothetical protein